MARGWPAGRYDGEEKHHGGDQEQTAVLAETSSGQCADGPACREHSWDGCDHDQVLPRASPARRHGRASHPRSVALLLWRSAGALGLLKTCRSMGKGVEGSPHPDSGHFRSCGVGEVEYLVRVEEKTLTPRLNHPGPRTVKPVTVQRCPLLVPQELAEGVGSSPFRSATDNLEFRKDFYFFSPDHFGTLLASCYWKM